jgi:hypothetical protein
MRNIFVVLLALAAFNAVGCKKNPVAASGASADSTRDATNPTHPSHAPTEGHPWTKSDVIAWIHDCLGLADINLESAANNGFTGTGKNDAGTIFNLKVTQKPGEIVCEYEPVPRPGSRGPVPTGKIEFKK